MIWALPALLLALRATPSWSAAVPSVVVDMTYPFDETTLTLNGETKFSLKTSQNGATNSGSWLFTDEITTSTHAGTHIDAPCHLVQGQICVDKIPLEHLRGPAAVLDITEKASADADALATLDDILAWEKLCGCTVNGTILVIRSGWGQKWGDRAAFTGSAAEGADGDLHYPGLDPEAALWLLANRKIVGVATEAMSVDSGRSRDFPAQKALFGAGIWALGNLAFAEEIPLVGARLHVMPMKISGGSGAPTRVMATFPHLLFAGGALGPPAPVAVQADATVQATTTTTTKESKKTTVDDDDDGFFGFGGLGGFGGFRNKAIVFT